MAQAKDLQLFPRRLQSRQSSLGFIQGQSTIEIYLETRIILDTLVELLSTRFQAVSTYIFTPEACSRTR